MSRRTGAGKPGRGIESPLLLSLLRGPAPPRVRPDALANTYTVSRDGRNHVVLTRASAGAKEAAVLAFSNRRARVDWQALARAIMADALDGRPTRRLGADYARFIVTPRGGARTIPGHELQEWLETWRPGLPALFGSGR